jgi:ubiquinone/menaquinone biosynthesis C-methylase UbiE
VFFDTNLWNRIRYTLSAPIYDRVAGWLKTRRRRSLELLDLQPGERVLLVGAGTGLDLGLIRPGPLLTAIDLTPAMIKRLRRRARRRGLQVDARVMDAHALEFPDGSFDVVILHFIVAVVPDPVRCMREAARVLRPGGRAAILDKFVPDGAKTPLLVRLVSPLAHVLATEITRQLGPILEGSGLRIVREEPLGMHGMLKVVVVTK